MEANNHHQYDIQKAVDLENALESPPTGWLAADHFASHSCRDGPKGGPGRRPDGG
jgi:hypothetical protein